MPEPVGVHLVPLVHEHVPGRSLAELTRDPDSLRFTRIPEPPPEDFAATAVQRYVKGRETGEREAYALVDEAGTFLGVGMLPVIERQSATVEIGYIVSPGARRRGVATQALSLLTDQALELGAERIVLHIAVANPASQGVAERCGYHLEGVIRSEWWKPGVRADTQLCEPAAVRPAATAGLTPDGAPREPAVRWVRSYLVPQTRSCIAVSPADWNFTTSPSRKVTTCAGGRRLAGPDGHVGQHHDALLVAEEVLRTRGEPLLGQLHPEADHLVPAAVGARQRAVRRDDPLDLVVELRARAVDVRRAEGRVGLLGLLDVLLS